MISIIIPAYNEEKYLPKLLECIKKQTYKDYEIIVADANSKDRTRQIAKKHGCRTVNGGMPSVGRNNGAKAAKGDILLFLDADSLIEKDFLENALGDIEKRNLDVAGSYLHPLSGKFTDRIFLAIFNAWTCTTQFFYPNACGSGIFCKKSLHEKVNGFDETIKLSEDMDYVRRAGKYGKFRIIKNSKLVYSMRRYDKEGRFRVGLKLLLSAIYRLFFGEIRSDVFNYNLRYRK
ncbi:glycosyltransferase [Candidatus Woesearchaeota archaeon]|nr:glycosyltransferase [Candidatus Woesearchaeota archaeon]